MEVTSIQKNVHSSPRKLRLVADLVRKMKPARALTTLEFTNRAAADDLAKAIKTALGNARQQNLDEEKLAFAKLEVNEGIKMGRFQPGARGRVRPFRKKLSHIRIVLTEAAEAEPKVKKAKVTKKEEK